jgi:hypothetical protein
MLALYHNDMSLCEKVRVCLSEKDLEWESRHLALRAAKLSGGIAKWENADYLMLMKARGGEASPQVQDIIRAL